jgi:diacylglycerol kinase
LVIYQEALNSDVEHLADLPSNNEDHH